MPPFGLFRRPKPQVAPTPSPHGSVSSSVIEEEDHGPGNAALVEQLPDVDEDVDDAPVLSAVASQAASSSSDAAASSSSGGPRLWGGLDDTIDTLDRERKQKNPTWESPEEKARRRARSEESGEHEHNPETVRRMQNKVLKEQLAAAHGPDKAGAKRAYKLQKAYHNGQKGSDKASRKVEDAEIKERNARLRAGLEATPGMTDEERKQEYQRRRELTHKEQAPKKQKDHADKVSQVAGGASTPATLASGGYASSSSDPGLDVPIAGVAGPALGALGSGAGAFQAYQDMNSAENEVQRDTAKREFRHRMQDTGTAVMRTGARSLEVAEATGLDSVAEAVPGLGLGISAVNLARGLNAVRTTTRRIDGSKGVSKAHPVRENNVDGAAVHFAAKSLRKREKQRRATAGAQVAGSSIALAGNIVSLTGVGAIAGAPVAAAGSLVRQGGNLGSGVENQLDAKAGRRARRQFAEARAGEGVEDSHAQDRGAMVRDVLMHNPDLAVQHLIMQARQGDPAAVDYLRVYNVTPEKLAKSSDEDVRKKILAKVDASEDAATLGLQAKGVGDKARDVKRKL